MPKPNQQRYHYIFFSNSPGVWGLELTAVYADVAPDGGWIHNNQGQDEVTDQHYLLRLLHRLRHFLRHFVHRGS